MQDPQNWFNKTKTCWPSYNDIKERLVLWPWDTRNMWPIKLWTIWTKSPYPNRITKYWKARSPQLNWNSKYWKPKPPQIQHRKKNLTQEDKINVESIKKILTEKKTEKKVNVEPEKVNRSSINIVTSNIAELNELIYVGTKLVFDKIGTIYQPLRSGRIWHKVNF